MLEINYDKFVEIVSGINKIWADKNTIEYKYISKYITYKKKVDANYSIKVLFNLLKEGYKHNKKLIYRLRL